MTNSRFFQHPVRLVMQNFSRLLPSISITQWLINIRFYYIFGIFGILLGMLIQVPPNTNLRTLLLWATAHILSFWQLYYFWLLIKKCLERWHSSELSPGLIVLVGAVGGAFQAFCFEVFIWLLLLPNNVSSLARLSSAALIGGIWLPAQSVIVVNFTKYQRMREVIQDEMLHLESVNLARKRLQETDEEILRNQISKLVTRSQDKASAIFAGELSKNSFNSLPELTRGLASEHLRLLAHKISSLDFEAESKKNWWSINLKFNISFFDAIISSVKTRPLNKEWFLLVLIATISLPLFRTKELDVALMVLFITTIAVYLIHWVGFLLYEKLTKRSIFVFFGVTFLTMLVPILLFGLVPGNTTNSKNEIGYLLSVALITCFGHLAQAGLLQQKDLLEMEKIILMRTQTENAQINFRLAQITSDWAAHIHGNIQSRLYAYALVLEQAQSRDDFEGAERAIEEISRTIRDLDQEQSVALASTLKDEVSASCNLWEGLVDFSIQIQNDLHSLRNPIVIEINRCLTEAISNAMRHGRATNIKVLINRVEKIIKVEVRDDGTGLKSSRWGLGCHAFETRSETWSLDRDNFKNETVLTLEFALWVPPVGLEPTLEGF